MKNIIDINSLSKGIVLYIVFCIGVTFFIQYNEYKISNQWFTIILLCGIVYLGYYTARISQVRGVLNSFILGLISSSTLIFMISKYIEYDLVLNIVLITIWSSLSLFGGFFGYKMSNYDE